MTRMSIFQTSVDGYEPVINFPPLIALLATTSAIEAWPLTFPPVLFASLSAQLFSKITSSTFTNEKRSPY